MLRAPPALNHSICSGLKVWFASKSTVDAVGLDDLGGDRLVGCEVGQAEEREPVVLLDLVVHRRVGEGERQHALLLQVRLVDAGEAARRG